MTAYAIGDIHGCYEHLMRLLDKLRFDDKQDCLWLTGDLVNRGPDALAVLRFISSLEMAPIVCLGNHDLHFLAVYSGAQNIHPKHDAFEALLNAPDIDDLAQWLCQQRLAYFD